jgi:hypothetical protein
MSILVEISKYQKAVEKHAPEFVDSEAWRESVIKDLEKDMLAAPLQYKSEIYFGFNTLVSRDRAKFDVFLEYFKKYPQIMFDHHFHHDRIFLIIYLNPPELAS